MDTEKPKAIPHRGQQKQADKQIQILAITYPKANIVRMRPQHQALKSCPDGDPADKGPKNIIPNLIIKGKAVTATIGHATVKFQPCLPVVPSDTDTDAAPLQVWSLR